MIRNYNDLVRAVESHDLQLCQELARQLLGRLKANGVVGWNQIPLTGDPTTDEVIQSLDPYLTGPRF